MSGQIDGHQVNGVELPQDLDRVELALLQSISNLTSAAGAQAPTSAETNALSPAMAAELFEAQVESRLVDHTARWLRGEFGVGYYTIGSAGHESNAVVAMALRPSDPALLHYRSGGFYFGRASQLPGQDPTGDVLRGMLALTTDQISGGRHKVFGNKALSIIPQTSTIASHLPRAVGLALSIGWSRGDDGQSERSGKNGSAASTWPEDAVVVCSFGDASLNHSTAQGALNWAANAAAKGQAVPILFVCEDNGLGISVPTSPGWVESSTQDRPAMLWAGADGHDPDSVYRSTAALVGEIRHRGTPGLLHLRTVRYLGHAGTDVESAYRSPTAIRSDLQRDPILGSAQRVVADGTCSGDDLVRWYLEQRNTIRQRALSLQSEPELQSAEAVMAPLRIGRTDAIGQRTEELLSQLDQDASESLTVAQTINRTLATILDANPRALVFGEDVGRKGGVYGVTRGLQSRFGESQVFDTILDEQSVLGQALGAALNGYLPIPEIQYLAYLHNAEDQLRGEAATLAFFSNRQYQNPMVVRVAGYAYQRGFGGHFHNDNSVAVLRDIPGLIIGSPAHPSDAAAMLCSMVAASEVDGAVGAFIEPIARYHSTDLHHEGDGLWTSSLKADAIPLGSARTYGNGRDGTMLTWGNGLYLSLRAQQRLRVEHGEHWRVVDLRWLAPLPHEDMMREADLTGRTLVVDETRLSGGVGEGIVTTLIDGGYRGALKRVAAKDSFIPLGAAANLVLIDEAAIIDAARGLAR